MIYSIFICVVFSISIIIYFHLKRYRNIINSNYKEKIKKHLFNHPKSLIWNKYGSEQNAFFLLYIDNRLYEILFIRNYLGYDHGKKSNDILTIYQITESKNTGEYKKFDIRKNEKINKRNRFSLKKENKNFYNDQSNQLFEYINYLIDKDKHSMKNNYVLNIQNHENSIKHYLKIISRREKINNSLNGE